MNERIKTLAKRILPAPVVIQIRRYLSGTHSADVASAWEFKRKFLWTTFKALDFNGIDGDYAEFGSHGGMTFRLAFDEIRR